MHSESFCIFAVSRMSNNNATDTEEFFDILDTDNKRDNSRRCNACTVNNPLPLACDLMCAGRSRGRHGTPEARKPPDDTNDKYPMQ